jgi:hypothetical protein
VPDFVANCGALVYDDQVMQRPLPSPLDPARANAYLHGIFDRTEQVFALAARRDIPYWSAAVVLAEAKLNDGDR